jgi:hypothetical protein
VQRVDQSLAEILASLRALTVEWQDEISRRVVERIKALAVKPMYTEDDVRTVLEGGNFDDGMLILRLFLGMSKDQFGEALASALGEGGGGVKRYRSDPARYLSVLVELGMLDAMVAETRRPLHWSDTLVERLRSGRGSAISGQKRGRGIEDFAEDVVKRVFDSYEARVAFVGPQGGTAKCDIAIPDRNNPRILVEAKGYGATGSKMTDIIGDIERIVAAKRSDTTFLFFTDGLTWRRRQSDLRKIVGYQNQGDITRIYTFAMADRFEANLRLLKQEYGL